MADKKKYSGIGGQAVMEGIMMRNKDVYATAVRKPDGGIEVKTDTYKPLIDAGWTKLPFIRGVFSFIDSLRLGLSCLSWSAEFYDETPEKDEDGNPKGVSKESADLMMGGILVVSMLMAIVIFMLIPFWITEFLRNYVASDLAIAAIEGVLRLVIFIVYIVSISAMKDIKRVYQYHGAEHKCINCIERGYELNVKNVMKSSRLHSRCGTSFLLFVVFISIILFLFIRSSNPIVRLLIRIVLIPVIAGISYEVLKLAGKSDNVLVAIISAPGLALQKLTTKEPDEEMVEVAIKAVEAVFDWREYFKETFGYDAES